MPQIPTRQDLGRINFSGRAQPAQINPVVAYDIGKAGAAWKSAFDQIGQAFGSLGAKAQAVEDQTWLAENKLAVLQADDEIRRQTELEAGADGTGFEAAPIQLKEKIEELEKRPGGSQEARTAFKLWSAESAFKTGSWAANTAQKRLRDSTIGKLDTTLDTLINLTTSRPENALDYFQTYEQEVRSLQGTAITVAEADERINQARQNILKTATVSKAIADPAAFARAVGALEGSGVETDPDVNTELRSLPKDKPQASSAEAFARVSGRLETGTFNPLRGVRQVARDAGGTKSYGNFGLNSGGGASSSAGQFQRQYGERFGLTAKPGTAAFDKQWRNAAGAAPVELHAAEMEWYEANIASKVQSNLIKAGVAPAMASDPRVQAYFADRMIQYGPAAISGMTKHRNRVRDAFAASDGDVEAFLGEMSKRDLAALQNDFPTALRTGRYSARGHNTRVTGRERLALGVDGTAAPHKSRARSEAERLGVDPTKLPRVDGAIQPEELLSLSPEDYQRVVRELRPHLEVDLENKMQNALAAVAAKGKQDVITPEEIDDYGVLIGPKRAEKWKLALIEAEELYDVTQEVIQMTPGERRAKLSSLVPTGRIEDLAADERRRFEIAVQAVKGVNTQMQKDPLGFLTLHNESGRQAMKAISEAPLGEEGKAIRERAFDTLITLQRREGVPLSSVSILGEEGAQVIANQLNEVRSGPAAKALLDQLEMVYGRHFNQMWGEVTRQGAPATLRALTTANRRGQDALVETYVMERASADSEGKDGAKKTFLRNRAGVTEKELGQAVSSEIMEFTRAIDHGVHSADAREIYRQAVERVAMKYMITDGKSLSSAVRQAADDVFRSKVDVQKGIIIPREELERRSHAFQRGIDAGIPHLIDKQSEFIGSNLPANPAFNPDYGHSRYISSLKTNGKYITNDEGTGIYVIGEAGEFALVDTPDGPKELFFTWDEIEEAGKGLTDGIPPRIIYDSQGIPRVSN